MHPKTIQAQNTPPARWDDLIPDPIDYDTTFVAEELLHEAIGAVRRAAYFNARSIGRNHASAVHASNRVVRSVAKSLGYSYPKSHELSF
jgi:hypothetical protein